MNGEDEMVTVELVVDVLFLLVWGKLLLLWLMDGG